MMKTFEVDLHQMTVREAKKYLDSYICAMPKGTAELVVIHGFNMGRVLQRFVRSEYTHKRVEKKIIGLNQGSTIFLIK
jgi:DNA-nicking Smr family endonuclease